MVVKDMELYFLLVLLSNIILDLGVNCYAQYGLNILYTEPN